MPKRIKLNMEEICALSPIKLNFFRSIVLLGAIFSLSNALASDKDKSELTKQAKVKIQTFSQELKSNLQQAIKHGGLEAGIEVCQQKAPQIAQEMSSDGWTISRTSLKARNENNQPNPWQKQVLQAFQQKLEQGSPVGKLSFSSHDDSSFKLMKAIPIGPLCLSCHGTQIPISVKNKLNELYPNDKAVNFSLQDIRGAFVIEKQL